MVVLQSVIVTQQIPIDRTVEVPVEVTRQVLMERTVEIPVTREVVVERVVERAPAAISAIQAGPAISQITAAPPAPAPALASEYGLGQPAALAPGVTVRLSDSVTLPCTRPGVMLRLLVRNSSGRDYLLRWDRAGFSVVDDLGNSYPMADGGSICRTFGLDQQDISSGPADYPLHVGFGGNVDPRARSLVITVAELSGVGPLVFRLPL